MKSTKRNVTIDGKRSDGARGSVSVPGYLWDYFVRSQKDAATAKALIRDIICNDRDSRYVQAYIVSHIVKPSLKPDQGQMDIEDYC